MSISEFLFLDNFSGAQLAEIVEQHDFDQLHYFSFIDAKADSLLDRWKAECDIAGMQSRVQMELNNFFFARKRCNQHFKLRPWHLGMHGEIRLYRRVWAQRLKLRLAQMRVR